ncbi:MAG: bifunctional diaminohydroxyphosphoribosylaminopyrimidine deaminase/5-amino-6-(5-phosphoribosylamino)uracil reductase RibD [Anaerolineae bacterium]|nr:bifunctional diaminohydroxyphosphoribosylaminopyrimidine deaminase/5-amino-6-(5-phosphoribosylamino)uracil reductase RibD [Anaerolineae bacterium]
MERALRLAERGRGRTSPNPMVGAVLVKDGEIVGEGFHPRAGEPHAEVFALRQAGERARGAILYVNLEPCCHYGRTPPCTRALIAAGVAEVHLAMLDPNPLVAGRGRAQLEAAGIRTVVGEREAEARALNEVFVYWVTTRRPFVIAKFAMSLDGKTATRIGDARWITGPSARQYVHRLRDQVDAILVGVNTVIADDPRLTTRLEQAEVRHPLRVILDSRGRIPTTARVLDPALPGQTVIATTEAMPLQRRRALVDKADVLVLPADEERVSPVALLAALGEREVTSLLVEGGGTVLGSFFAHGLVDKVLAFVAPMIIGGQHAPTPVGGPGAARIAEAWRLTGVQIQQLGADVLISGYPTREAE